MNKYSGQLQRLQALPVKASEADARKETNAGFRPTRSTSKTRKKSLKVNEVVYRSAKIDGPY